MDYLLILLKFLLQGVPESAAVIFTTFAIVGYKVSSRTILFYAIVMTTIIYLLRMLPIPFGIHSLVGFFIFTLVLYKIAKVSVGRAIFVISGVMFLLLNMEFAIYYLLDNLYNYKFYFRTSNGGWLWIVSGWPQVLIMWGIGYSIRKYFRPLFLKYYV